MKNSKSDSWILQAGVAGNPYPRDKIRYSVEFSTVHLLVALDYITSIWKLLQFILLLTSLHWQYESYERIVPVVQQID